MSDFTVLLMLKKPRLIIHLSELITNLIHNWRDLISPDSAKNVLPVHIKALPLDWFQQRPGNQGVIKRQDHLQNAHYSILHSCYMALLYLVYANHPFTALGSGTQRLLVDSVGCLSFLDTNMQNDIFVLNIY